MKQYQTGEYSKHVYHRLIALWVICEAFTGGIMHAAKLPFSGLIISSLAVTCIILIAYYVPTGSAILKATVIVAIFKLMLSPHSPPTAYIAVFFQGLMGQLLLRKHRFFNIAAIVLAVLALVESAIQRILVLVIVYGNDLWKALNIFIQKLTKEKDPTNYSFIIAASYILLHAVAGIFVGMYASRLAKRSADWKNNYPGFIIDKKELIPEIISKNNYKRKKLKLIFVITWFILLVCFIQSYFYPAHAFLPSGMIINILTRSVLILLSWFLIISPLLVLLIKRLLKSQQQHYTAEINEVMLLIPQTRSVFKQSFRLSENKKGFARVKLFFKILLINILADQ
jgi:hypothetical protein